MAQTDRERLQVAKLRAREAIAEVLDAQLCDRHLSEAHKAHLRWRFANPEKVVDRILDLTLLDRLEVSGL